MSNHTLPNQPLTTPQKRKNKKSNMKNQSTSNRPIPQSCSQKSPQHQPPQHCYVKPSATSIPSLVTLTNHPNYLQSQASPYTMMQLKQQAYLQNLPEATRPKLEPAIPPSNNGNSSSTTQLKTPHHSQKKTLNFSS